MFKNKKRVIALIMAALIAASAVGTSVAFIPSNTGIVAEAAETQDGLVYTVNEDNTVTITKYTGTATEVVIPEKINYLPVTTIDRVAFGGKNTIESLTIPAGIQSIGDMAFYGCTGLKNVYFNGTIDQWVQIDFGSSGNPISSDYNHEPTLYINNQPVTDINITTADKVSNYAFYWYKQLKSVVLGDSVKSIGDSAFFYNFNLESVIIGDNVETIGSNAFYHCDTVTSLKIGNKVKTIGDYAFYAFKGLTSLEIPDSVTDIGKEAFVISTNLKSLKLGKNVANIGKSAFDECAIEGSLTLPKTLTELNWAEFADNKISSVTIPETLTKVGRYSFLGCNNLTTVYYHGTKEQWDALPMDTEDNPLKTADVYCNYHPMSEDWLYDKTNHWHQCIYCDKKEDEAKHDWNIDKSKPGVIVYTCKVCGHTKTEKVADYTLTFNTNGGSEIAPITKFEGTTINLNSYKPTKSGYDFAGWFSDKNLTKKVTSVTLNANTTVYAKWTASALDTVTINNALNSNDGIKFTWNKVANADGYKIYRKTNDKWEVIAVLKGADTTHYLDKKVLNGTRYTYAVRAYNASGLSEYTTKTIIRVVAPQLTKAYNNGTGSVYASWQHNSQASGYVVRYSTGGVTKYVRTYGVASNTATLKNLQKGKTYEIQVRAYKTIGLTTSYSDWSQPKYVTIKK